MFSAECHYKLETIVLDDSGDEIDGDDDPTYEPEMSSAKARKDKSKKRASARPRKKKLPFEVKVSNKSKNLKGSHCLRSLINVCTVDSLLPGTEAGSDNEKVS